MARLGAWIEDLGKVTEESLDEGHSVCTNAVGLGSGKPLKTLKLWQNEVENGGGRRAKSSCVWKKGA